jgi:tetratricopeptide (TPR) repeat protein
MGEAMIRSGRCDEGRAVVLGALRGSLEGVDIAEVALRLAPGFFAMEVGAQDVFVEELVRSALSTNGVRESGRRSALLRARLAAALYWCRDKDQERASLASAARSYVRTSREHEPDEAWIETFVLLSEWTPDTLDTRICIAARLAEAQHASLECRLVNHVVWIASLIEAGRLDLVDAVEQRFRQRVGRAGIRQAEWYVTLIGGMLAVERGELPMALSLAERMLGEGSRAGDKNAVASFGALGAMCHFHQNPDNDLVMSLREMVVRFPGIDAWETALGVVLCRCGDLEAAVEILERRLQGLDSLRPDMMLLPALAHLGEMAADLRHFDGAESVLHALAPYAGRRVPVGYCVTTWGSIDRIVGRLHLLLGRLETGAEYLRRAISSDRAARSWVWLAYSYLNLAELLAQRNGNSPAEALDAARRGLELARRSGQVWVGRRAESVLREVEERSAGASKLGPEGLRLGGA